MAISKMQNKLESSFTFLNDSLFDGSIKPVFITIQSQGRKKNTLGWASTINFWENGSPESGKQEINICAEYLKRPVAEIMETMVHEMVHIWNAQNSIKDCSKSGRHNMKFKTKCESVGLNCEKGNKGYNFTSLESGGKAEQAINAMDLDENSFTYARSMFSKPTAPTKMKKWSCGCTIVRCAVNLMATCQECGGTFNIVV